MITGIVTFLTIVAVIGSILYGRRLIKTEKTDAVFGNPERAKGGMHWVVVGSSFLLLSWLYYSWDIAKSLYPKSANELCQVAKVTESLLSLKYLFPIEERQHKSTAVIERETVNIATYISDIKNDSDLKNQDKEKFIGILNKTQAMLPSLTNEKVTWDEAYDFIKNKLDQTKKKYGPDAIAGISSARCTNEENYVFQKMIRAVIGTNNIDCCARICHSPTAWGLQQTFGTGAATNSTEDIYHADLFLVIGANPTNAHPVIGAKTQNLKVELFIFFE